jgi:nitrogen fixation/metabolism regulation signal transduction histidine kinase
LTDAKRAPEIVIVLKCKEKSTFDRCIDDKKIRQELENDIKKREEAIKLRKENERKAKLAEVTEEIKVDEENEERNTAEKV